MESSRKAERAVALLATPIERMLDAADWKPIDGASIDASDDGIPVATHEGALNIAGHSLRVFTLSDGRRIIDATDLSRFLGLE